MIQKVTETKDIKVYKLDSLLKQYPQVTRIDYLNIEAEGFEMDILSGLDFDRIAPKVISIEQNDIFNLSDVPGTAVAQFLAGKKYIAFAKNVILPNVATIFYIKSDLLREK